MKILIVTDAWTPQVNGVVTTLKNTIAELRNRGHSVYVLEPSQFFNLPCPGYREIHLSLFPSLFMTKLLDGFDPDKIHIATEGPLGIAMRKILTKRGEKWSSSFHTRFAEYVEGRLGFGCSTAWRVLRAIYKRDSTVLVTTESMKQELVDQGFDESKLIVWGRGVDEEVFFLDPDKAPNHPPIYMNVGRVSVEKNLEAFYNLKLQGARKVQVGDGPMLETYKAKYPNVEFLGAKFGADLAHCYKEADVMVFPSKSDTFGLVMIEAMRCGTPVAAYPVTGPVDIIENGRNGYMDDNLALAITLARAIPSTTVIASSNQFTWARATDQFLKALVFRKKDLFESALVNQV